MFHQILTYAAGVVVFAWTDSVLLMFPTFFVVGYAMLLIPLFADHVDYSIFEFDNWDGPPPK